MIMTANDLEFVTRCLKAMRPTTWKDVSEKSGVPLGTITKIAYSAVSNPRFWTVKKLADTFREAGKSPEEVDIALRCDGAQAHPLLSAHIRRASCLAALIRDIECAAFRDERGD